ncbi:predicted protein [Naegleria gruberi]|uniref:Predicted protein n=1 Tax=Naegleria gruberi TaxID=5762 RepID=D2VIS1_NAEGR|nr:uncharacterized protein NAEGRDRAFT_68775 [Naegleria gruberi]EFC43323.1 predicted protein [Naegleria gruberi]|eukprot:XP_002676067.1 predicted protein [Naegleria gruberi strain NEG-M]
MVNKKLAFSLIILLLSLITVSCTTAIFNLPYTTISTSNSFSFPKATDSCSLIVSFNRTLSEALLFTMNKYSTFDYKNLLPDSSFSLLGVYEIILRADYLDFEELSFDLSCQNGITNVSPQNMRIYTLESGNIFKDTNSYASIPTNIVYSTSFQSNSSYSKIIGFAGKVDSGIAIIGYVSNFFGPYEFKYRLKIDSNVQTVEALTLSLPNIPPQLIPYGLLLDYTGFYYDSNGYTSLYAFSVSSSGVTLPNFKGATLQYSFQDGNTFRDVKGNAIQILKSSLACFISADGYSFTKIVSTVTSTALTCSGFSNVQYIAIAATPAVAGASSSSGSKGSAIQMYSGNYVYTNTIYSKVYYEINVESGKTLTLSSISLNTKSNGNAYITIDSGGDSSTMEFIFSTTQLFSLTYTNYNSYSKTIYVSVEPSSSSTNISFLPYISDYYNVWSYRLPVIITVLVIIPCFTLFTIITVMITIKKNSRQSQ